MSQRTVAYAITAMVAIMAVLLIGKCSGDEAANTARTEMLERNAEIVARAYKAARDSVPKAIAATDSQKRRVYRAALKTQTSVASLTVALDAVKAELAANTDSARVSRSLVVALVAAADSMLAAQEAERIERTRVDSLHLVERRVLLAGLAAGEARHVADARVIASLKAERCTVVFGIRCPTRTQSAVVGSLVTIAAVVALK